MAESEYDRLLGGYATGTLTEEERRALFEAALQNQELFNALGDEQALKELLDDPVSRRRLLHALEKASAQSASTWLTHVLEWFRRPANLGLAGSLATAVIALVVGINVYKESGFREAGEVLTAEKHPVEQPPAESAAPLLEEDTLVSQDMERKDQGPQRHSVGGKTSVPSTGARSDEARGTGRAGPEGRMAHKPKRQQPEGQAGLAGSEEAARSIERRGAVRRAPQTAPSQREPRTAQPPTLTDDKTAMAPAPQQPPVRLRGYFGASVQDGPARDLFYSPGKQAKPKKRAMAKQEFAKRPAPSEPMRPDAAREEAKSSAEGMREQEKVGAVTVPTTGPLGLRYSILRRDRKGTYAEADPEGPFRRDDALRLTVEANAPGYLYVLQHVRMGQWLWLFPPISSGTVRDVASTRVVSGRRYMIPETGSFAVSESSPSSKMILVFSREPRPELNELIERTAGRKPRIDQLATDLDNLQNRLTTEAHTTPLQVEEVKAGRPGSPSEQAVYVVAPNPSPNTVILAEFQLRQD